MPFVFDNNKYWLRGGKLNHKRPLELSEEEKANVATCKGLKDAHICKNPVFRCSECGNYGCDQKVAEKCDAQAFKNGKCLQCGEVGSRIPVMKDELERFIAEFEKEVPTAK